MNGPYQPSYGSGSGASAMALPMEQHLFPPSPLEQKLYDGASNALQRGKDYLRATVEAIDSYRTSITDYLLDKGSIMFSKKGRAREKAKKGQERLKKNTAKEQRMRNPSGGSPYAQKKREGTFHHPNEEQWRKEYEAEKRRRESPEPYVSPFPWRSR